MNSPAMPLSQLTPVPVDRVRMIRSSMRCWVFGLFGVIPLFGFGFAWLAFRMHRRVASQTGDRLPIDWLNLWLLAGMVPLVLSVTLQLPILALLAALLGLGVPYFLIFRQYRQTEPVEWNPARHLMYYGVALAFTGHVLSTAILILVIWAAIWRGP